MRLLHWIEKIQSWWYHLDTPVVKHASQIETSLFWGPFQYGVETINFKSRQVWNPRDWELTSLCNFAGGSQSPLLNFREIGNRTLISCIGDNARSNKNTSYVMLQRSLASMIVVAPVCTRVYDPTSALKETLATTMNNVAFGPCDR